MGIGNNALSEAMRRLPEVIEDTLLLAIERIIDASLPKLRTHIAMSSPMTNYGGDDKHANRELRRQWEAFFITAHS